MMLKSKFGSFILIFAMISLMGSYSHGEEDFSGLRDRLERRKKSFDKYLRERDKGKRSSKAAFRKIKQQRKQRAAARRRARESYQPKKVDFPIKAYRKFIAKRDRKLRKRREYQRQFQALQKRKAKIVEQPKYKIDKERAYRL